MSLRWMDSRMELCGTEPVIETKWPPLNHNNNNLSSCSIPAESRDRDGKIPRQEGANRNLFQQAESSDGTPTKPFSFCLLYGLYRGKGTRIRPSPLQPKDVIIKWQGIIMDPPLALKGI